MIRPKIPVISYFEIAQSMAIYELKLTTNMECGGPAPLWYCFLQLANWDTKAAPGRRTPYSTVYLLMPFVMLIISLASACSSAEADKQEHVRRGRQYLEQNKFAEARIEFRSALQIDRKLAEAHFGLGEAALSLGYVQEAAEAFYQTMRLDPANLQARIKAGNLLAQFPGDESLKEAERLAGEVLKRDPASIEGLILTSSIRMEQKRWDEAQQILEQIIASSPKLIEPRLHLARYFSRRAAVEKAQSARWIAAAESLFQKLVESHPQSAEARLAFGDFLFSSDRAAEAEVQLLSARRAAPSNKVVLLALVKFYESGRRFDEAEKYLSRLVEIDSDKREGRAQIIELHARTGRNEEAIREYRQLLREDPRYLRGYSRLGELLLEAGDIEGATREVNAALRLSPQDTDALLVRGRLHTLAGRHQDALRDLDQVLRHEPSMPSALYFGSEASLQNNDPSRARLLVNRLLSYSPRNPMGLLMMVRIQLTEGRFYEAEATATQAIESIARLKSSGLVARGGSLPSDAVIKWECKALVSRAAARMQLRENDKARNDLESAIVIDPRNAEPHINLATMFLSEGRIAEAMRSAGHAVDLAHASPAAVRILVDTCLAGKDFSTAHRKLDELQKNSPEISEQKARVFLAQGDRENAEKTLRHILASHPDYLNAYFALSDLYQSSSQQTDRAIAELRGLIDRRPGNVMQLAQAHLMIGLLEDGRGAHRRAIEQYEKVLGYDRRSAGAAIAMNNIAWLYAEKGMGNLDQAVDYARRAIAILPEAGFFDTLGYAYFKKGQYPIALEQFSRAVAGRPTNPVYHHHLALAMQATGNNTTAKDEFKTALRLAAGNDYLADQIRRDQASLK